jgi:hypothetical protein
MSKKKSNEIAGKVVTNTIKPLAVNKKSNIDIEIENLKADLVKLIDTVNEMQKDLNRVMNRMGL